MAAITEAFMQIYKDSKDLESNRIFGDIEEIENYVERKFNAFTNFARISRPPSNHHYLNSQARSFFISSFRQRIKEEWKLLEGYLLGSSIFVRAYEERIDLMRAAIMGPKHTPYHHCLFFFDIYFPSTYPHTPPKFHYLSYGLDLNPHLHLDGKVSVPLLEKQQQYRINYCCLENRTRGGKSFVEGRWNPNQSNISKVFDAIQQVILSLCVGVNPPPKRYEEERVFAAACEKMIRVLRRPPRDFEEFLVGHLRKRAHHVLLKFKDKGYEGEEMKNLFADLVQAFEQISGAYCKHHLDFSR